MPGLPGPSERDNSNRETVVKNGATTTFTYAANDRLTSYTGMTGTIGHDTNGNITALNGLAVGWDATDRNTSMNGPGANVTYARDSGDRVTNRTENGVTTTYLHDSSSDAPIAVRDGAGSVLEWYVGLPGGVTQTVKASGNNIWLFPNIHGDTLATIGPAGTGTVPVG